MDFTIESLSTNIFTGATNAIYSKTESDNSHYKLLMGNAISELGEVTTDLLDNIEANDEKKLEKFLVNRGDVAILARGSSIRAGMITADIAALKVIPSASFVIIRPDNKKLLGEVLVAYLNSSIGQSALAKLMRGVAVQSVSASDLKQMTIQLPTADKQNEIAELFYVSNEAYKNGITFIEQQRKTAIACMLDIMMGAK